MNIFMIGYRCTGKSSVGKSLAAALGWTFIDADSELVKEQGLSISDIVSKQGWDAFREMERDVIKRLSRLKDCVVATGGGAVLDEANVNHMKQNGMLVWLKARPETISKRMLDDKRTRNFRPALTSKDLDDEIEETLASRRQYYEQAMDFFVDTDTVEVEEICRIIIKHIKDVGVSLG
jgi:shikimate kinase